MFRFADIVRPGDSVEVRRAKIHEYYSQHAASKGGALLSPSYSAAHAKMLWRCAAGHEWEATANSIRRGSWCDVCAKPMRVAQRKEDSFTQARMTARLRGGRCLSTEFHGLQVHLSWRCRKGHVWSAVPGSIIAGTWCPVCAGTQRLTLDQLRADAAGRGGDVLSTEYRNGRERLRWRCGEGHEFEMSASNVRQGRWCPVCSGHAMLTLDDLRADAATRGGECLARVYVDVTTKVRWRCRVGHVFAATPNHVRNGGWCPRCHGTGHGTIERMHDIARRRRGQCLSREYVSSAIDLRWRCREGHEWSAPPQRIVQGGWCRICRHAEGVSRRRRLTIEDMQQIAAARGGSCVSSTYTNSVTPLLWRCHAGHEWWAIPAQVKHKSWCPSCARSWRGTIDGMRALAAERGGRCLSTRYEGHGTTLDLECAHGHRFNATGRALKTAVWCERCVE